MTAAKNPRKPTPAKNAVDYGVEPTTIITAEDMEQARKPFVFQIVDEVFALKSPSSFSLDEAMDMADLADEDERKIIPMIAFDERSEKALRSAPNPFFTRVLQDWFRALGASPGESVSSET